MAEQATSTVIARRLEQLEFWLEEVAPYARFDQRHLDAHTPEQAYWHLGYAAALRDLLALSADVDASRPGSASRSPAADPDA